MKQTQSTKLSSIVILVESRGRCPVMISKSMTPNEKTSDFSVSFPLDAYSGAKFDVTVDNPRMTYIIKVNKGDIKKLKKRQKDKFINQHSLGVNNAISNKGDKMAMMNSANDLNFSLELPFPLSAAGFQALDGDFSSVGEDAFVNVTETALAQQIRLRKPGRGGS
nr:hypothetical protein BHE74_00005470 [Ipomoea trifida]